MKILAVNIAFRTEDHYARWRMLTKTFSNTSLVLVGPKKYVYNQFGKPIIFEPEQIVENNFKVSHIDMENKWYLRNSDWWDLELFKIILREKPDLIFYNIFSKIRWFFARKWYSFTHVHYPNGKDIYENTIKFKKPICMQTQVGVNKDVYFKSSEKRAEIRKKYKIEENDFVFGSAIRIQKSKGVFDILDACEKLNFDFKFLLLGDGADTELVKERIENSKVLKNRIIWPGRIDGSASVAAHLNAMDAFIHIPHTTESWVDTFPLAVVQAMATRLPVIGSDSGAVPYQLGDEGLVIREGNVDDLIEMMEKLFKNKELAINHGENLYHRVLNSFEIKHLNSCLHQNFKAYLDKENGHVIKDQVKK